MCHSKSCHGYRSPPANIPEQIWVKYLIGDEADLLEKLIATDDIDEGIEDMKQSDISCGL